LIALLALLATAPTGQAQERLWAALVLATQAEHPSNPPAELAHVIGKVEKVFGYNQVEILGTSSKRLEEQGEHWLVPSQHFWLCVKAKRAPENKYNLQISMIHDKRTILETEATVSADCPLLIRGPLHARGQLIIALQVLR
jgi:hypothetical protein